MTDRPDLADAWRQVPGLAELEAGQAALAQIVIPPAQSVAAVQAELTERLAGGEILDGAAIVEEMASALAGEIPVQAAAQAVAAARLQIHQRLIQTRRAGAPAALRWLHAQLQQLLDDVRPIVAQLDGVQTADDALRVGGVAAKAWPQFTAAAERYAGIRALQRTITVDGYGAASDPSRGPVAVRDVETFGLLRDQRHLDPVLVDQTRPTPTIPTQVFAALDKPKPWPTGPADFLRWAVTTDAEPWVPDPAELQAEAAAHAADVTDARMLREGVDPGQVRKRHEAAAAAADRQIRLARQNALALADAAAAGYAV